MVLGLKKNIEKADSLKIIYQKQYDLDLNKFNK
jgi:hypothetical protein